MGNGCRIARVRSKVDGRTYPIYYMQSMTGWQAYTWYRHPLEDELHLRWIA